MNATDAKIELKLWTLGDFAPLTPYVQDPIIKDFEAAFPDVSVTMETASSWDDFYGVITDGAQSGSSDYDLFVTPPLILGSVVQYDGFKDLSQFISESYADEWQDILPTYRDIISSYDGKQYMMPFDGDALLMYYNLDILDRFNLTVPRTWEEYNEAAAAVHGQVVDGETITGSCIGRARGFNQYWASLVLATMTQTDGYQTGSLLSTDDMAPLTGEALTETLAIMESQTKSGAPDELSRDLTLNVEKMDASACLLTINWGNQFKAHLLPSVEAPLLPPLDPIMMRGKLGVAPTPGSLKVLDRKSQMLVDCTEELCPNAVMYDDIGLVNHVPYAAFSGFSGAVNANSDERKQKAATKFLAFTAGIDESDKYIIPNATSDLANSGFDPFRESHLNVTKWTDQGYERETSQTYIDSIQNTLASPNSAIDLRIPTADSFMNVLDESVHAYLVAAIGGGVSDAELAAERRQSVSLVNREWAYLITKYDEGGNPIPLLEQYQKLRGVYDPESEPEGPSAIPDEASEAEGSDEPESPTTESVTVPSATPDDAPVAEAADTSGGYHRTGKRSAVAAILLTIQLLFGMILAHALLEELTEVVDSLLPKWH